MSTSVLSHPLPVASDRDGLSQKETAARIGVSYGTFRNMRSRGYGPQPYYPVPGGRPRWRPATVDAWIEQREATAAKHGGAR